MPETLSLDRKPAGTRSGSETRQMQYRTTLRWNGEDYARLQADADRAGMAIGTYIRSRVLAAPSTRERRRASIDLQALAKLLAQVMRVGGLLHQLVKHLNFRGIVYPDEAQAALRSFDSMVAAVMDAMERVR